MVSLLPRYVLRGALGNHAVRYAVTLPGVYGSTVAFVAEMAISFLLMITVLFATNHKRLAPYTAYLVGVLIATYYTFGAPLSGMSTNPARTLGSAVHANYWHALWIYFIAPSMGMLAAGQAFLRVRRGAPHIALNFTTPTANAASSITPNTKFERRPYATTSR